MPKRRSKASFSRMAGKRPTWAATAFSDSIRFEKNAIMSVDPAEVADFVKKATDGEANARKAGETIRAITKNPEVVSALDEFNKNLELVSAVRKQILELAQLNTTTNEGINTDTMILVHVPSDGSQASFVSFPRDSWVEMPQKAFCSS